MSTGDVAGGGVSTADGTTIGVGDIIVTRLNVRALASGRGWVKNGDDWIVRETGDDGSMRVARTDTGDTANLPADYVADHVELGYATTAHRAQGRTVDTTHSYVCAATMRESLYVMATRGRESNRLYLDTSHDPDVATSHDKTVHDDPADTLRTVITTSGVDAHATHVQRAEQAPPWPTPRIEPRGTTCPAREGP